MMLIGTTWVGVGVHSPALPLLAVAILFAGFTAGNRAGLVTAGAAVLAVLGLLAAEMLSFIPGARPQTAPSTVYICFTYALLYVLIGWLTYRYSQLYERTFCEEGAARRQLASSERELRAIVETAPECVKVLAIDGMLMRINPAGLAMIEARAPEDVFGSPVENWVAESFRPEFWALHGQRLG